MNNILIGLAVLLVLSACMYNTDSNKSQIESNELLSSIDQKLSSFSSESILSSEIENQSIAANSSFSLLNSSSFFESNDHSSSSEAEALPISSYVGEVVSSSSTTNVGDSLKFPWFDPTLLKSDSLFIDSRDGNEYRFTVIGEAVWMAQNLRYNPETVQFGQVMFINEPELRHEFGGYYSLDQTYDVSETCDPIEDCIDSLHQGACPIDWHIPTPDDYLYLGEVYDADDGGIRTELAAVTGFTVGTWITDDYAFSLVGSGRITPQYEMENLSISVTFRINSTPRFVMILGPGIDGYGLDRPGFMNMRCVRDLKAEYTP
ncbi:MAG: hypothetical protein OCD01_05560 [Fibrobacterales bacterium]